MQDVVCSLYLVTLKNIWAAQAYCFRVDYKATKIGLQTVELNPFLGKVQPGGCELNLGIKQCLPTFLGLRHPVANP